MSLNDGALDGIDEDSVVDNDLIKQPDFTSTGDKDKLTIQTNIDPDLIDNRINNTEDTIIPEVDLEKINTFDVSFNLVGKNVNKIIELQDVEAEIVADDNINVDKAVYVNESFGGLLGDKLSIKMFSKEPSKINLSAVKSYMKKTIATETIGLTDNFNLFISSPLQDTKAVLARINEVYINNIIADVYKLQQDISLFDDSFENNKNAIVKYGDDFVNLTAIPIVDLEGSKITIDSLVDFNYNQFDNILTNLKNTISHNYVKTFIYCCIDNKPVDYLFTKEAIGEYADRVITLNDLHKMYKSNNVVKFIEQYKVITENLIVNADKLYSDFTEPTNDKLIKDYVIENTKTIQNMICSMHSLCKMLNSISVITLNYGEIAKYF